MTSKKNDRLAEIRARVARRAIQDDPPAPAQADLPQAQPPAPAVQSDRAALAAASAHFLGAADLIIQNKQVERIPVGYIAPDLRPDMRQPRLLPPPDELLA